MYDILIADDEERIRKAVREYAEFEGYHVSEAAMVLKRLNSCVKRILTLNYRESLLLKMHLRRNNLGSEG